MLTAARPGAGIPTIDAVLARLWADRHLPPEGLWIPARYVQRVARMRA